MATALITVYACNPYKGSEDGTGWNIIKQIAKKHKVIAVTRNNNRKEIERYLAEVDDDAHNNLTFKYFDLPEWAMFWKKKIGPRGYVLYYYLWQLFMPVFLFKNNIEFDIAHSCNFHSDSHPNFLWVFRKPTIWGPIGHHPPMPEEYLKHHESTILATDRKYAKVKWIMRNLDPLYRLSVRNSDVIIGVNSSVSKVIGKRCEDVVVIPAAGCAEPKIIKVDKSVKFQVLSAGRFTSMKGFDIVIESFSLFYNGLSISEKLEARLKLIGTGEEETNLRKLISALSLDEVIEIIPWIPYSEMGVMYLESSVFFFPSHEGAGMVVPEAMSYGLPILCFDNVGPGELAKTGGIKVKYKTYQESVHEFAAELKQLYDCPRPELGRNGEKIFKEYYSWDKKGEQIRCIYDRLLKSK
jgi:glycosyltransferase involved in cell wall biosynthesis